MKYSILSDTDARFHDVVYEGGRLLYREDMNNSVGSSVERFEGVTEKASPHDPTVVVETEGLSRSCTGTINGCERSALAGGGEKNACCLSKTGGRDFEL